MLQMLPLSIWLKSRRRSESSLRLSLLCWKKEMKENANILRVILTMAIKIYFFLLIFKAVNNEW